jgi:hypothetical protein
MSDDEITTRDLPLYTASAVNFQATAWILRIAFGELADQMGQTVPGTPGREIFRVAVGLPWPLVKVVHEMIGQSIEAFEKQEGTISVPKTLIDRIAAAKAEAATKAAEEAEKK